jgi:hypothetical protein
MSSEHRLLVGRMFEALCLQRPRTAPATPDNCTPFARTNPYVAGKHRMVELKTPLVDQSHLPGMRVRRGCSSRKLCFELRVVWIQSLHLRLETQAVRTAKLRSYSSL